MLSIGTLFFLIAFTLVYLANDITKKPELMENFLALIQSRMQTFSIFALVFSLAATVLAPFTAGGDFFSLMVLLISNLLIILMSLPITAQLLYEQKKISELLYSELKIIVGFMQKKESITGYAGLFFCLLVIITMLR